MFQVYKIISDDTELNYYGSTKLKLSQRLSNHKSQARKTTCQKKLSKFIRDCDYNIKIELIKKFDNKFEARLFENSCILMCNPENCINSISAYSYDYNKTRDNEKKKKSRRDYYHRKKQNPEWILKERERNKIRMRKKRANLKKLRNSQADHPL